MPSSRRARPAIARRQACRGASAASSFPGEKLHPNPVGQASVHIASIARQSNPASKPAKICESLPRYSAAAARARTGSTLAAQNLNSGILPNGSSCGLVSMFAAASA